MDDGLGRGRKVWQSTCSGRVIEATLLTMVRRKIGLASRYCIELDMMASCTKPKCMPLLSPVMSYFVTGNNNTYRVVAQTE